MNAAPSPCAVMPRRTNSSAALWLCLSALRDVWVLQILLRSAPGALLLLLGCTANVEPDRPGETPLPALVARRVTATVQRETLRLLRLETEHEAFLTTPEHPFATPRSGWVSAGRLAPGDWVLSERFGAVRLVAVRSESAPQKVPVFNLSVASSHAYFVGTDRVLVHNTTCKRKNSESHEEAILRLTRERDELNRRIEALRKTTPTSPRIAELRAERIRLQKAISKRRSQQLREQGVKRPREDEQARQRFEADKEAVRKALEAAQKELAHLESLPPTSAAAKASATHKARIEKRIPSLKLAYERTNRILSLLRDLAKLEKKTPATDAERRALEEKKKELRTTLTLERKRARDVKSYNTMRIDPERHEKYKEQQRARKRHARDRLEPLEEELAGLLQAPPSESRDARIYLLTEQIGTMKELAEVLKKLDTIRTWLRSAKREREKRIAEGGDTTELDRKRQEREGELYAARLARAQLRVRAALLAKLEGTPWAHAPASVDEAQLREFEQELAAGLVNEPQLANIERALDAMDPTHADLQEALLDEADDVDEVLREWEELQRQSPSPERDAGLQSSFERLQQELRGERHAYEAAVSALVNEHAHIQNTQASSSSGATWQQRLSALEAEMVQLRAGRRERLEDRLERARQQLDDLRRIDRSRDEASEAELAREIALLERELQNDAE